MPGVGRDLQAVGPFVTMAGEYLNGGNGDVDVHVVAVASTSWCRPEPPRDEASAGSIKMLKKSGLGEL
jgi:hypothetical protein